MIGLSSLHSLGKFKVKTFPFYTFLKYYGDTYKVGNMALQVRTTIFESTAIPTIYHNVETWSKISWRSRWKLKTYVTRFSIPPQENKRPSKEGHNFWGKQKKKHPADKDFVFLGRSGRDQRCPFFHKHHVLDLKLIFHSYIIILQSFAWRNLKKHLWKI